MHINENYVIVNEVPTLVLTVGKELNEKFGVNEKELILFLVGNPGIPTFYENFLMNLYTNFDAKIPVWAIGAAGHNYPSSDSKMIVPELKNNEHKYNLQGQINHKVEFIRQYIPADVKIYIVAHSMGSLLTVRLLKYPDIKSRFEHCYLLFPMVERMGEAPRARGFKKLYLEKYLLLKFAFSLFYVLPFVMQKFFVTLYFILFSYPLIHVKSIVSYLNPLLLEKSIVLTKDLMDNVHQLDYEFIEKNKNLLKFYYGSRDGWAPLEYFEELKRNVPGVDAEVDSNKMPHTFVFKRNNKMADIITEWIQNKKQSSSTT